MERFSFTLDNFVDDCVAITNNLTTVLLMVQWQKSEKRLALPVVSRT